MSDLEDNNSGPTRKMAAILAADVVGYSKLMATNEALTLKSLKETRLIIDRTIVKFKGRIFNTAGDSVMAEFASPVEAVESAVEFQKLLKNRNLSVNQTSTIHFRVGINLGDIMIEKDNLFGDNVNIAARLESIAIPGEICISEKVYQEIFNKVTTNFNFIGEKSLKNITHKIKVYSSSSKEGLIKKSKFLKPIKYLLMVILGIFLLYATYYIYNNFIVYKNSNIEEKNIKSVLDTFRSSDIDSINTQNNQLNDGKIIVALMKFDVQNNQNQNLSQIINDYIISSFSKNPNLKIIPVSSGSENLNPPEVMLIATESNASFIINGIIYNEDKSNILNIKLYEARRGTNLENRKVAFTNEKLSSLDSTLQKIFKTILGK